MTQQNRLKSIFNSVRSIFLVTLLICTAIVPPTSLGAAEATLLWDPNGQIADYYEVYARTEGEGYDYVSPIWTGDGTSVTLTDLAEDSIYYFVVRAILGGGESQDSNEVKFYANADGSVSQSINDSLIEQVILDNDEMGTSSYGKWRTSGGSNPYGSTSLYSKDRGAKYIYKYQLSGNFDVFIWWSGTKSRCSNVPVKIYDGKRLLEIHYIDQSRNSGQWFFMGNYDFSEQARIVITARGDWCSTCADAVQFSEK